MKSKIQKPLIQSGARQELQGVMKNEEVLNNDRVWRIARTQFQRCFAFRQAVKVRQAAFSFCGGKGMKRIRFLNMSHCFGVMALRHEEAAERLRGSRFL